ncbi:MAG: MATE family efflux transporter [Pseudomonadota bacterium]
MSTQALSDAHSLRDEFVRLLKLAAPLIVNNLALAGMGFADTVMSGEIGATTLAAVGVGSSIWMLFFLLALGILMAISPLGARHVGGGRPTEVGRYARQGLWLALGLAALIFTSVRFGAEPFVVAVGIDPGFRDLTIEYLRAIAFGAPAICLYLVLRYTTEAVGRTLPVMVVSIIGLVVNVVGNYAFMFGNFGAPALGAEGAGLASALMMWSMLLCLFVHMATSRHYREYRLFAFGGGPRGGYLKEILALGLPIMVSVLAEAGLFGAVSLLMGKLSASIAAAHQVALNYASTMFMIPMGLNSAITVLVSNAIGRDEIALARMRGYLGIAVCGMFMALSATFMLVFRDEIVNLYSRDGDVQAIALSLLFVAAVFQISDGIQVGAAGALRGLQDTKVPMFLTTLSYWVIAFPLAYSAALTLRLSPAMIWGGFVVGLTVSAVLLVWRYWWISGKTERLGALADKG